MKKILSFILSLTMIFSMCTINFAAESSRIDLLARQDAGVTILLDNKDFRISQAISGDERYVSTLDKSNNIITSERYSISKGTLQASAIVDLKAETITDKRTNMTASTRSVVASKYTQSTYSYEYTNDNPKEWKLVRAKYANESNTGGYYFKTKQTTTNANNLDDFRKTVNSIGSAESELLALVGTSTFLAGFATGFAVGSCGTGFGVSLAAYIAAAGFGLTAQQKSNYIGELQDTALSRYIDIKNQSSFYF